MKYPTPSVSAVIFNREGKVLLTRRSVRAICPGTWSVPGGRLDGGLDWLSGVRKEVKEDVALELRAFRLFGIYSDPALHRIETGSETQYLITAGFLVTEYEGEVRLSEAFDAFDWFVPGSLPGPILPSEPIKIGDALAFKGTVFVR